MKIIRTREVHDIDLSNNLANCEFTHTLTIYNIHICIAPYGSRPKRRMEKYNKQNYKL